MINFISQYPINKVKLYSIDKIFKYKNYINSPIYSLKDFHYSVKKILDNRNYYDIFLENNEKENKFIIRKNEESITLFKISKNSN